MGVNSADKTFFNNRLVLVSGISIIMLAVFFIVSSFTQRSDRDLRAKQVNLIIRDIGHRLLLQAGDSTSRVLPVTEIREGTFFLPFENDLAFSHDSLMMLAQTLLAETQFPSGYTVTVHGCKEADIVYGFQINPNAPDILACSGRTHPPGCYAIEITFPDLYAATTGYPLIHIAATGALALLSVVLLVGRFRNSPVLRRHETRAAVKESVSEMSAVGKFLFDVKDQRLVPISIGMGSEVISLTDKECRILELLNENFGELIPRETLMQKVWINEGVITGRSLDMFVSKLRKKLSGDPELRITNVHGKGYKLEMHGRQVL